MSYLIKKIVDYKGELYFNTDKPDGMPQKLMDVSNMLRYGWTPRISLEEGIQKTFQWFIQNYSEVVEGENDKD